MFMKKNWVQHDQGEGDRTCLQILRLALLRNPDPLDRRRTRRHSNLTYKHRDVTNGAHENVKQTIKQTNNNNLK